MTSAVIVGCCEPICRSCIVLHNTRRQSEFVLYTDGPAGFLRHNALRRQLRHMTSELLVMQTIAGLYLVTDADADEVKTDSASSQPVSNRV